MQKKILGVLFVILFLGVVGVIYSFFNYTESSIATSKKYLSPLDKNTKIETLDKSWIDSLVKNRGSNFQYPVNELFMHIDLQKYIPKKVKYYKLVIQNADRYSLFCVMRTLQSFKIPSIFTKERVLSTIYLESSSVRKLRAVMKKLKLYNIDSKIVEDER